MSAISNLISPLDVKSFFQNYWSKKSVFIPSNGEKSFDHLFSWDRLNSLLNFHEFDHDGIRLSKNGKVLDPRENIGYIEHLHEGGTLIIDRVHKLIPELSDLVSQLNFETGWKFQVNMYCSGGGKQGFACHYDTHEVFAMQIEGQKEWHIFKDTHKYPLKEQKFKSYSPPEGKPLSICTLNPGDVLYIPRGHWHYAIAHKQPSLHLTLGVHCPTGIDFLEWLISEFKQEEMWRRNLPMLTDKSLASSYIENLIQDLCQCLNDNEKSQNIVEGYLNHALHLDKPLGNFAFPSQLGLDNFPHGRKTKFFRPKFQRVTVLAFADGSGYKINVSNKEIVLKGITESLVENLFANTVFTGDDVSQWLPGFDWDLDIVPLLSRLIREGIIFVDGN